MQQVFLMVVVVEVREVFSLMSIIENTRGQGTLGDIVPVGAPGARGWWQTLISRGIEILLAIKNHDRVRGEQQAICGGKQIVSNNVHWGKGSGGKSHCLVNGSDGGVSDLAVFLLMFEGPPNVSVFYWEVVVHSSSPMTNLVKVIMLQQDYTPLSRVTDFVGFQTVVVPVSPKHATILTTMSLGFSGKLAMTRGQRVMGVFLVEH